MHTNVQDTFYVIDGQLRLFLRDPKEEIRLGPGDTYSVKPRRPHLVINGGTAPPRSWCSRGSASTTSSRWCSLRVSDKLDVPRYGL